MELNEDLCGLRRKLIDQDQPSYGASVTRAIDRIAELEAENARSLELVHEYLAITEGMQGKITTLETALGEAEKALESHYVGCSTERYGDSECDCHSSKVSEALAAIRKVRGG